MKTPTAPEKRKATATMVGSMSVGLGDNVRVKVARINAFRSEIDFELVEPGEVART